MAKRLYRSTTDRKIAGVCGGLAEYFEVDSTIVRLIFIVLLLVGVGSALLLYVIMWLLVPEKPANESNQPNK
jgi:phage shock protein C